MNRPIATLLWAVIISITTKCDHGREIQKVYFAELQEPFKYVYKFEAFFIVPNALTTTKLAGTPERITSPPITSYNYKSGVKWYVSFYTNPVQSASDVKYFEFKHAEIEIPYEIKKMTTSIEMSMVDRNGTKHETVHFENVAFLSGHINHQTMALGMTWSDAIEKNLLSANGDLTLHFKADAVYEYQTPSAKTANLQLPSFRYMAKATIDDLDIFRKETVTSDVTLKSGDKEMKCHKSVLGVMSSVLERELEDPAFEGTLDLSAEMSEIELEDFVLFLYTGEAYNFTNSCLRLFPLSKKYRIPQLTFQCEQVLVNSVNYENCAELYRFGDLHDAINLQRAAAAKIAKPLSSI